MLALSPNSCYLISFSLQGYYYADVPVTYRLLGNPWIDESTVTFFTHLPLENTYIWDIDEENIYNDNTEDTDESNINYPAVGLPEQYHLEKNWANKRMGMVAK